MDMKKFHLDNQKMWAGIMLFLVGGIERWVVYPLLLWIIGFGGYLLGDHDLEEKR
ncbi:MAG: hypothetical protein ACQESD_05765 [Thermoplasmatota archaeon]